MGVLDEKKINEAFKEHIPTRRGIESTNGGQMKGKEYQKKICRTDIEKTTVASATETDDESTIYSEGVCEREGQIEDKIDEEEISATQLDLSKNN